ncbi:MAG: LCP family protein [Thermoflexales bacterium]|nr:LCP family protein [Thermoflexales bacterium]
MLLLLATGLAGSYLGYTRTRAAVADYVPPRVFEPPAPAPQKTPGPTAEPAIQVPDWDGVERIQILLIGIDQREDEEGPWRTDTVILVSVNPVAKTASMLSIPRDVWTTIPGFYEDRINNAHFLGEAYDYPGGGPALAKKTVQYLVGVPVHYYVRVNFTAFEKLVDLIGGIDIDVPAEINDPEYPAHVGYGYEPLFIPAGRQHLNGEMALKYARFRHDDQGDFGRAHRQQQVILAIRDQVLSANKFPELLPKAPQLAATLEQAVQTDLSLDQILRLAKLGTQMGQDSITGEVVDEKMVLFSTTPDGQQVLIPLREEIRKLRERLYVASHVGENDLPERQIPRVTVLNGTLQAGLASQTAAFLTQQGFRVSSFGNATRFDYAQTLILDYSDGPVAAQVAAALGVPPSAVQASSGDHGDYDIQVILGADYAARFGPLPTVEPTLATDAPVSATETLTTTGPAQ